MGRSLPVETIIAWKRRSNSVDQWVEGRRVRPNYLFDTDAVTTGIQNQGVIDNIPHDPSDEIIDVFNIDVGPSGAHLTPSLVRMPFTTTLDGTIDASTTSVTVDAITAADWPDDCFVLIGDEYMQITSGGGTTSWTVRRAEHGTTGASHTDEDVVERVIFNVPHEQITLSGNSDTLAAPTIAITAIVNGAKLTVTPPSDPNNILTEYDVYRDTSTAPTAYVTSFAARTGKTQDLDVLLGTEDKSATYYYRIKAVTRKGTESDYSNEVSGQVLTTGEETTAVKPTAPTVTVAADGGQPDAGWKFVIGVTFTDAVGKGGVTATEVQVADFGDSHSTSTGFTTPVVAISDRKPPLLHTATVYKSTAQTGGDYQFSARIWNAYANGGAGEWSDWSAPVDQGISTGETDADVPGVPVWFSVSTHTGATSSGNAVKVQVAKPATNHRTIWGYEVQAKQTAWSANKEDTLGLDITVNGTGDISTGSTSVTNLSVSLGAVDYSGDIIYLFRDHSASTGTIDGDFSTLIASNTSSTITIDDPDGFFATVTTINWSIGDAWRPYDFRRDFVTRGPLASSFTVGQFGGFLIDFDPIPFSEAAYWRVRACNQFGRGPWLYYDNADVAGTTTLPGDLFTPAGILSAAIEDAQITTAKVVDGAITPAKQVLGTIPAFSTLTFTATSNDDLSYLGGGTVYYAGGSTESVTGSTFSNISTSNWTWIYKIEGNTTLQKTTTLSTATGDDRVILAVALGTSDTNELATVVTPFARGTTIGADRMAVGKLSAITADVGELTAGTITGLTVIRTAASGARVQLSSADGIEAIDSGGTTRVQIPTSGAEINFTQGSGAGGTGGGKITFGSGTGEIFESSSDSLYVNADNNMRLYADGGTIVLKTSGKIQLNEGTALFEYQNGWMITDEASTNPTSSNLTSGDHMAVYKKADTFVIAYNDGGTITYLSCPLDGSTTTWTNSSSAP